MWRNDIALSYIDFMSNENGGFYSLSFDLNTKIHDQHV